MEFKLGKKEDFLGDSDGKNLPAMQETWVRILGQDDPLEKGMATHFSIFAWCATVHGLPRVRHS